MTQQYLPEEINQIGYSPVNVQTPDANAIDVVLGTLSANGSTMTVQIHGGGSGPNAAAAYSYSCAGNGVIFRDAAGVLTVSPLSVLNAFGVTPPTLALVAVGDNVVLRITPADATVVNHRIQAIINTF